MAINLAHLFLSGLDLLKGNALDDVRKMVAGEGQVRQFEISHKKNCSDIYWQVINELKLDGWVHACKCLEAMKDFEFTADRSKMSEKVHKDQWERLDAARVNCKVCLGTGYVNTITIQRDAPKEHQADVIELIPNKVDIPEE